VELHPAAPAAEAAGGSSTSSRGLPPVLPPSRRRGSKRPWGREMGPCSGRQVNSLPAYFTFPVALTQQMQGSGM